MINALIDWSSVSVKAEVLSVCWSGAFRCVLTQCRGGKTSSRWRWKTFLTYFQVEFVMKWSFKCFSCPFIGSRAETIPHVTWITRRQKFFPFNSHQDVLLSGRPVSHGHLLLSHNERTCCVCSSLIWWRKPEETKRGKIWEKEEKFSKVWKHFKEKKRENTVLCVWRKSEL